MADNIASRAAEKRHEAVLEYRALTVIVSCGACKSGLPELAVVHLLDRSSRHYNVTHAELDERRSGFPTAGSFTAILSPKCVFFLCPEHQSVRLHMRYPLT